MVRLERSRLRQLEHYCPELLVDARIVAGMLWRYRREFRTMTSFDDLVELAVAEVWFVRDAAPQLTQTERVSRALQQLRKELRVTRAQVHRTLLDPVVEQQVLEQLAQRDLLRRLQSEWLPGDFADLVELCDDSRTTKQVAEQRLPQGTPREVTLEYGRLRKLKRRLLGRARATLEKLDPPERG